MRRGQRRKAQAKQHREEDDRQHIAFRHGGDDIGRHQRQNRAHQAMRVALHFCRCALVFRNIHRRQLRHINTGTRLEHVGHGDTDNDRNRRDHFEIDDGFGANSPQLFCIANAGYSDNQRRNNNRHHNHFNQMDENIASRGQQIHNQPVTAIAMIMQITTQNNTQHEGDENLPG